MKEALIFLLEQLKKSTHDAQIEAKCNELLACFDETFVDEDDEDVDLGPEGDLEPDDEKELDYEDEDEATIATLTHEDK